MPVGSAGADIGYNPSDITHTQSFSSPTTVSVSGAHARPVTGGSPHPPSGVSPAQSSWGLLPLPSSAIQPQQSQSPNSSHSVLPPQEQASSMLAAAPMYYDPDQVAVQETGDYEQWIAANYPGQYTYSGNQSSGMGQMPYPQHSSLPQQQVANSAAVSTSSVQPHMQNQYQFVQSQYMTSNNSQANSFPEGYPANQHRPATSVPPPRIARTVPAGFGSRQHPGQRRPPPGMISTSYQHQQGQPQQQYAQQPQQYIQQQPQQAYPRESQPQYAQVQQDTTMASVSYFPAPSDHAQDALMPSNPEFTFTFHNSSSEHLPTSAGSNPSFTPSSEHMALSSTSPPSWAGTDDGHPSSTSYAPGPAAAAATATVNTPPSARRTAPSSAEKTKGKKRAKPNPPEAESGTDDDDSPQGAVPPLRGPDSNPTRLPGACTHCKKLKMKCDFPRGENTCRRCKSSGHPCIVEGRKPRNAPNKREYLLAQIRQKDAIIESLLKQLHNPYIATPLSIASYRMATSPSDTNNKNVLAWLDRLEDSVRTAGRSGGPKAFNLDSRAREGEDDSEHESDHEEPGDATERGSVGTDGTVKVEEDEKRHLLPNAAVPLGLIATLSLDNNKKSTAKDGDETDDDNVGVANETYFMPGPAHDLKIRANLIEQHSPPDILVHGLVTPEDVDRLFEIFYARLNPHVSVLDPVLHTPATTFARCPFLFTVVCAVASRYYADKSEIYPIAMHFAKHAAANALITGWKSVELAQAYIIMSVYGVPARRWEEDRGWLYTGLAIRIATDLNLHQMPAVKPTSERQERELINKVRVWMNCYNMDRSTATQFGKPSTIKEDYIVRKSDQWYKMSQYNHPYDMGLCAYTSQLRIMARFHDEVYSDADSPTGIDERLDFREVSLRYDQDLTAYLEEWQRKFQEESDMDDPACKFRSTLLPFFTNYSRLVMYSFAFQQAFRRGIRSDDQLVVDKCFQAAKDVILSMLDSLAPSGFERYAPDSHFIFVTFASAFLLKLLRPEFHSFLTSDQEEEIFQMIGRLIQTLNSPEIAIDDRHTPRLHARFLAGLLSRHRRDVATSGRLHPPQPPQNQTVNTSSPPYSNQPTSGQSSTQQVFSVTPSDSPMPQGHGLGHMHAATESVAASAPIEPVYQQEAAYTGNIGPLEVLDFGSDGSMDEDIYGGPLLALKSQNYWENMMMPGFQWSDSAMNGGFTNHAFNSFSSTIPVA